MHIGMSQVEQARWWRRCSFASRLPTIIGMRAVARGFACAEPDGSPVQSLRRLAQAERAI